MSDNYGISFQQVDSIASIAGWQVNDKLEWIWKESIVDSCRYNLGIFLEALRKTTETCQDGWCLGRFSNQQFSEYEWTTSTLTRSVRW
jgi:hypothetical protein